MDRVVQCCDNCMFCNDNGECTQSPLSENGPVKIPDDKLKCYKCREYVAKYPSDTDKYLKG